MIEFSEIKKSFGQQQVLDSISLTVKKGEMMVLLGASGSGKTTMLRMVNGLEQANSGIISVQSRAVSAHDLYLLRKNIGYVIQKVGLFPHYSVYDNVASVLRLKGAEEGQIAADVKHWLEKLGMPADQYAHKMPSELSGGESQRVGIARALAAQPQIVLLDEPFSALDPLSRQKIRSEFKGIQQQEQLTALMVTHDILEAVVMADRICFLADGKIQQVGTPREIIFSPANDLVKKFVEGDQFQASLAAVQLSEIRTFLPEDTDFKADSDDSLLECLQVVNLRYHANILEAFYRWKEEQKW